MKNRSPTMIPLITEMETDANIMFFVVTEIRLMKRFVMSLSNGLILLKYAKSFSKLGRRDMNTNTKMMRFVKNGINDATNPLRKFASH